MSQRYDATWSDASKQYQGSIGAISINAAAELAKMATRLKGLNSESHILDVVVVRSSFLAILAQNPDAKIEAIDTSTKMLDDLAANLNKMDNATPNVNARVVDIHDISSTYEPSTFTHVFASFVLHVAAKSFTTSVSDMYNILAPGGIIAIATFMPTSDPYMIWDRVARIHDPKFPLPHFAPDPDAWVTPGQVAAGMQIAGLVDIKSVRRRAPFPIQGVEKWTEFFFNGKNPASERIIRPFFETHSVSEAEVKERSRRC